MLSIDERISSLKAMELFADLSESDLEGVADIAEEMHFADDQDIVREGEKGDALYCVVRGQVRIHSAGVELVRRGQNACIGEVAVMDAGPRSASVSSVGDSLLLKVSRDDFYRVVQGNAGLLENVLGIVLRKFREDTKREIETARETERLRHEMTLASKLQMGMLPTQDLCVTTADGLSIVASGICCPAEKVGGDYFDYFTLPDGRLGLVIGDVMGHGFHTGLMVSTAISCLHTQVKSDCCVPGVMSAMNDMVYGFVHGDLFMSFCYIIADLSDHTISFCNAGHPYPYHYRMEKGQLDMLESDAFPLGVQGDQEYKVSTSEWGKGDLFVLYTDGIVEAENQEKDCFGEERLEQLIVENAHLSPVELRESVLHELDDFCHSPTRTDDVTLVTIRMG